MFEETKEKLNPINAKNFYAKYHGHDANKLYIAHSNLKHIGKKNFIYLCGDSTLDNKHWLYT